MEDNPPLRFRLISVSFKEAALDSPSFRASSNHLHTQAINIQQWSKAISSIMYKYPGKVTDMRSFVNSYLEYLVPGFVQDGLLDQEYTVPALRATFSSLKDLWSFSLSYLTINSGNLIESVNKISEVVAKYSNLRAEYEVTQEKYDRYFDKFMASPKVKAPQMSIEDAIQLYNARKEYLHASLNLVVGINRVNRVYDEAFINMSVDFWMRKKEVVPGGGLFNLFSEENRRIIRTKAWFESYGSAMDKLSDDMLVARDQVEDSTLDLFSPSTDETCYNSSLINAASLKDIDEPSNEKHGYLVMKTWTNNSTKPIWVKRWVFIKGGVFGLLVLSPSKTFVQETDKIGVLLSKVKYAPQEERRFCFEVKTSHLTLMFQAESLIELKSWLKVFDNERKRLTALPEDSEDRRISMGCYPPLITEFASTVDTLIDRQLTNTKILNAQGQIITSSNLSAKIKENEQYFQKHLYYQIPQIKPALMTSNTKTAIISYVVATSTALPTALTANTWGSINWGLYYLQTSAEAPGSQDDVPVLCPPGTLDTSEEYTNYPAFYPPVLVPFDIEMRSIFESIVERGEVCLVTFSCIWAPNSQQELSGRIFITDRHVLLYNQAMGFVSLFKGYFARLSSIEVTGHEDHEVLDLHLLDDVITFKVFVDDGYLIQRKINYLIENRISEKPDSLEIVLGKLANIENQFNESLKHPDGVTLSTPAMPSVKMVHDENKVKEYQLDYTADAVSSSTIHLPAKAVFHVFFGDLSTFIIDADYVGTARLVRKFWYRAPDGLRKQYATSPPRTRFSNSKVLFSYHVETQVENEYYNVTFTRQWFKFFGSRIKLEHRFVISAETAETTRLYLYSNVIFDGTKLFNKWTKAITVSLIRREFAAYNHGLKKIRSHLGDTGQAAKAIFLYGRLTVTDKQEEEAPVGDCVIGVRDTIYHVIVRGIALSVAEVLKVFIGICAFIFRAIKSLSAQKLLLFIIFVSCLLNVVLLGKSSVDYWKARGVSALANKILHTDPMMLQRAMYIEDYKDLINSGRSYEPTNNTASESFEAFKEKSFIRNVDRTFDWDAEYVDDRSKQVAQDLQRAFKDIGVKRHEMLVQFGILNDMERQIARGEWGNWLLNELSKCDLVQRTDLQKTLKKFNANDTEKVEDGFESILNYCNNCREEYNKLDLP